MRAPIHAINAIGGRKEMTPERIVGVGFVGLLHVIAIYAIVVGLVPRIVHREEPKGPIVLQVENEHPRPTVKPVEIKPVDLPTTTTLEIPPPRIDIAPDASPPPVGGEIKTSPTVIAPPAPATPDTAAAAIGGTHTTPPYPSLARKLGEQGQVQLRLTISPQGVVTAAEVVKTSGFADLDQAAVSWVLANWKYKPATQAGSPVASTANALVVFSLKTAR